MKWEYKVYKYDLGMFFNQNKPPDISVLNELGGKGWEMVSTLTISGGYGKSQAVMLIFKRKR